MIDMFTAAKPSNRASLALSEATLEDTIAACRIGSGFGDPENPPCARLVLSGVMTEPSPGSNEEEEAKLAIFERHPSFKNFPKNHNFFVAKFNIDGIWLIDAY